MFDFRGCATEFPAPNAFRVGFIFLCFFIFDAHAQLATTTRREFYAETGLLKSEDRDGVISTYAYHPNGDVASITDSLGRVTAFLNYKRGVPQTEIRAQGMAEEVRIHREVDDRGCITSQTDGEGHKTVYGRDTFCRLTSIKPPKVGSVDTVFTYTLASETSSEIHTRSRGNYVETKKFDGFGHLIEHTAGGIKRSWRYNELGLKTFESYPHDPGISEPLGSVIAYDALGRIKELKHPDSSTVSYTYKASADGLAQTEMKGERGHVIANTYQAFGSPDAGQLVRVETPVGAANLSIKRNVRGQITEVQQGGLTRTYGYDPKYYLTSVTGPEVGVTSYGRDSVGNMISVEVGTTGRTFFDHDALNQIWRTRYPDSTHNVTQEWDRNGRRIRASRNSNTRQWRYDANGNLESESLAIGGHDFVTTYSYDGNDRRTAISYPKKGSTLALNPDSLGRPTTVGGAASKVEYHPTGMIRTLTFGNGVVSTQLPDQRLRPATLAVIKGSNRIVDMTLNYDVASNLESVSDAANSSNDRVYGYDGIDRLIAVNGSTIAYDGVGNIRQQNFGGTLDYTYDATRNRVLSTSGTRARTYTYDTRGNITSDGVLAYAYDDSSRLRCAKCTAADRIDYDYDAMGMRISRTQGGQVVFKVYASNGDLLMDFNPALNQRQEHIYLQGQKIATSTQSAYFSTSTALSTSNQRVTPGQTVTLTATVTGRSPDGVVNFYDNGTFIGSALVVDGQASFSTAALGFGYHQFSASYAGDGANAQSATAASTRVESGQVTATLINILNSLLLDD